MKSEGRHDVVVQVACDNFHGGIIKQRNFFAVIAT
jgi:hypothetical protein